MNDGRARAVRVRAFAKLNLTLRVLGRRADGYHELRTTFQTIALHDTLTLTTAPRGFTIECDDEACPLDESNLVWRAADALWRAAGRRGPRPGVRAKIVKRIPARAGLGGGSSDAAAALRGLAMLWRLRVRPDRLRAIARGLGADVPFFLVGGTVLGVERGDLLFPLIDVPKSSVVIALPAFGVSTADAYGWWEGERVTESHTSESRANSNDMHPILGLPLDELRNDLEAPVVRRHPEIVRLTARLRRRGALHAAMSGSGSAVFALFDSERLAQAAADAVRAFATTIVFTTTIGRRAFQRLSTVHALG